MPNFDNILGRKLSFVRLEKAGTVVVFKFLDGSSRNFSFDDGWLELDKPKQLRGIIISSYEAKDGQFTFHTDRGDIVLGVSPSSDFEKPEDIE